jgi:predicted amidohydrolase
MQPFKVALCQVQAFGVEEAETNLDNILRALDEAGAAGAQLVALPECAYPAYYLGGDDVYTRPAPSTKSPHCSAKRPAAMATGSPPAWRCPGPEVR